MTARFVFIGETDFVGRALRDAASDAGHEVEHRHRNGVLDGPADIDVCVDLGARSAADVQQVLGSGIGRIRHYVLVSSYEVYPAGDRLRPWDEGEIDLNDEPGSEIDQRAAGLRAAERELRLLGRRGIPWTVLRPSVIEGKDDPVGHTRWFVERIIRGAPIALPVGDMPFYRQLHVRDLGQAVLAVAGREDAFFEQLNVTGSTLVTFEGHAHELGRALDLPTAIARIPESEQPADHRVPFTCGIERSFIAASRRLAALGWKASARAQWLPLLASELAADATRAPASSAKVAPSQSRIEAPPRPGAWQVRAIPAVAGSLCLVPSGEPASWARGAPLVRTRCVSLVGLEEWLARRDAPRRSVIAGHHAAVEVLDPGDSALGAGGTFLLQGRAACGDIGIHRDGCARGGAWRADDTELVPVPDALQPAQALLAFPLSRVLGALEHALRAKDMVWIFGQRVEAVLGAWLAADLGCEVIHVGVAAAPQGGRSAAALKAICHDVARGRAKRPRLAVNASGAPDGERLLVRALSADGMLATPFQASREDARRRVVFPWTPARCELERALLLLEDWSAERDVNACLAPPLPPARFQEALVWAPFKLPSIAIPEMRH